MEQPAPSSLSISPIKGLLIPLVLWLLFTPWSGEIDRKVSAAFYHEGAFSFNPLWEWIYHYALWPAWILTLIAIVGSLLSFKQTFRSLRRPALYILLTLGIGSGLIIHGGLKDHWGRPRPRQVIEFGGTQSFRPYYSSNIGQAPEPSKSFACGHASMGFYFFSLTFLGIYYRSRILYWSGMGLGWGLGLLLSAARIAQGGHFLSDTLASALIMWLTAWSLAYWLLLKQKEQVHEGSNL